MGFKEPLKLGAAFCAVVGAPVLLYSAISSEMATRQPIPASAAAVSVEAPAAEPEETVQAPPADQLLSVEERNRFAPFGALSQNEIAFIAAVEEGYRSTPAVRVWPYMGSNNNLLPLMMQNGETITNPGTDVLSASAQRQRIPFWQFWRRWETTGRPSDVCAFTQAEYGDELIRVAALIDELREDGLSEDEWRFQSDCMNSLPIPTTMVEIDRERLRAMFDKDVWREEFVERFSNWTPRDEWTNYGIAEAAHRQRSEAFQFLSDSMRSAYGLEPIPVVLIPLEDHHLRMGQFNPSYGGRGPAIIINTNVRFQLLDDPARALTILVEEIRHSIDAQMSRDLQAGKIKTDDPRFLHASVIFLNNQGLGYARSRTFEENGQWVTDMQSHYDYLHQYVERTAKDYAGSFVRLSMHAMNNEPMPWAEEEQPVQLARQAAAPRASL